MMSASTEPSSSSRRASSTNTTDSSATRLLCGGRSPRTCAAEPTQSARKDQRELSENLTTKQTEAPGAYDRPAELVEEARHGDRIGEPEGGGGLALPLAEALLRDVLVVGRLQRGRHGGGGGAGRGSGFWGGLGFHGRCRGQRGGEGRSKDRGRGVVASWR